MTQSTPRPEISVIIPVLDGADVLGGCLDALRAQVDAPSFEVLVVDNGSRDATRSVAGSHPLGAQVLDEPVRGPYAARNTGIEAARGRVFAFTDADCVPEPDWLRRGLDAIDAGADLVGGEIVQHRREGASVWERYDRATYLDQARFVAEQSFAATANLWVRREVVDQIGAFRPELVASGDLEFGQRTAAGGWRLVHSPSTRVGHHPRTTLADTWRLHRKLGSGFAELARHVGRGPAWRDPGLRVPFEPAFAAVNADGPPLRRRVLLPVHLLALGARWVGHITGRG